MDTAQMGYGHGYETQQICKMEGKEDTQSEI